jgi:inner membrane protein
LSGVPGAQGQRGVRAGREAGIDPICHTLVGAGLARSGLARRTALGTTTLLIGANLPDVDVLAYFSGPAADLAFRRGWTHGIPALMLWPFLLTGAMIALDRGIQRARRASLPSGLVRTQLLLLSSVAVLSHPILDTLNTYGMRWLMPFSGRWFYGDTLFIVDPWLWLALGVGVLLSRPRQARTRPARMALGISFAYVVAMAASALAARRIAGREMAAITGEPPERLLVSPFPVNPFARTVVVEQKEVYRTARFHWLRDRQLDPASVRTFPKGPKDHPAVRAAVATTVGRRYLGWARFPAFQVEPAGGDDFVVRIVDLRYADPPGGRIGSVSIPVTIQPRGPTQAGSQ